MGETLKKEFQPGQVITGMQSQPGEDINIAGMEFPGAAQQPAAPISRPTFLSAFLQNLGPALAGGAGQPSFEAGLGGALQGIEGQRHQRVGEQMQQQTISQRGEIAAANLEAQQARQQSLFFQQQLINAANRSTTERGQDVTARGQDVGAGNVRAQIESREKVADLNLKAADARAATDRAFREKINERNIQARKEQGGQFIVMEDPFSRQIIGAWNPKTRTVEMPPNELTGATRGPFSPSIANLRTVSTKLNEDIRKIKKMYAANPQEFLDRIGLIQGNWEKIKSKTAGSDPQTAEIIASLARITDNELRIRSGAQIGEYEYPRLEAFLPTIISPDQNFLSKLAQLEEQNNIGARVNRINFGNGTSGGPLRITLPDAGEIVIQ